MKLTNFISRPRMAVRGEVFTALVLAAFGAQHLVSQERQAFEVASVKVNTKDDDARSDYTPSKIGERVTIHNTIPKAIVDYAYHIDPAWQISGEDDALLHRNPAWYDIDAETAGAARR